MRTEIIRRYEAKLSLLETTEMRDTEEVGWWKWEIIANKVYKSWVDGTKRVGGQGGG